MDFKEKIFTQAVICCMIFTVVKAGAFLHSDEMNRVKSAIKEQFEKNYTAEEVMETGSALLEKVKKAPAVIASSGVDANRLGEFGEPIDEDASMKVRCVYATNAGKVLSSGISKELGSFVKIQHDKRISTYGNLAEVKVVQGEKVKKGDIIGTYRSDSGKKFYYDLEENLQT